ncbi:MAG: aspartate carbamoyltransferase catalytic subunit, partial [Pseudomonadota bacterium]
MPTADHSKAFPHRHLLGIDGLSQDNITYLLDLAAEYAEMTRQGERPDPVMDGRTVVNLFFENSTRTQSSFEIAAKRLGADVINMPVAASSVKKGETLIDTAVTLNAMRPDALVIRHSASGGVKLLSRKVDCAVINAGDGTHEHPTQALLDLLTIRRNKGQIRGLTVVICGDIAHSRVARSTTLALSALGAKVRLVAPKTLMPSGTETWGADQALADFDKALDGADVVMMLRLQLERMDGAYLPSRREYFRFYGLT